MDPGVSNKRSRREERQTIFKLLPKKKWIINFPGSERKMWCETLLGSSYLQGPEIHSYLDSKRYTERIKKKNNKKKDRERREGNGEANESSVSNNVAHNYKPSPIATSLRSTWTWYWVLGRNGLQSETLTVNQIINVQTSILRQWRR